MPVPPRVTAPPLARASGTCPRARAVRSVCVFAATLALCIILCGVSGSGKTCGSTLAAHASCASLTASLRSAVGRQVAAQLRASFLDADDQHSQAAKGASMHHGSLYLHSRSHGRLQPPWQAGAH